MRRIHGTVFFSAVFLIALASCGQEPDGSLPGVTDGNARLRIVTLSPHLAELVYAVGAGDLLVGVSSYSNFPEPVSKLPQIGDAFLIDYEQLLLLQPDMVLAWQSGTPSHSVDDLRRRGYRVEVIRTNGLSDIAAALEIVGKLTGYETNANSVAAKFMAETENLRRSYAHKNSIRVFYQISARPLYTVNSGHYISELIDMCGGKNVFGDLDTLAPLVSEEAVLVRNPEAMIAGGIGDDEGVFSEWQRWPALAANALDNYFLVSADLLARPTPRLVQAGVSICEQLDMARANRQRVSAHQQ